MKLVASLIVRNEIGRYLSACVEHLLEFCDEIRVLDDASEDGTSEWLTEVHDARIQVKRRSTSGFYEHEGRTRNELLTWTLAAEPTHVLTIDADEFVADGAAVRRAAEGEGDVWTLQMEEAWELDGDCICIREDGGWRTHPVPILYRVPDVFPADFAIMDRALACGREPVAIRRLVRYAQPTGTEVIHFGWANEAERVARHERYAVADGGQYHSSRHLDSILWPPEKVRLEGREWPPKLAPWREGIVRRVNAPTREKPLESPAPHASVSENPT